MVDYEFDLPIQLLFRAVVYTKHQAEMIELLERTGADERWLPAYEALKASQTGTLDYLRKVAPQLRGVSIRMLRIVDPKLFPEPLSL